MTTDDDLLQEVTAYLDSCEGTTILPESILDDIRADLPKTSQIRPHGLARFMDMSTPLKIGVAAAVVAVVAFLGLNWLGTIQVGPPPSASDRATPSADSSGVTTLPAELLHPFLGPDPFIDGLDHGGTGDLDFTSGILQFSDSDTTFITSTANIAADGQLRFETVTSDECAVGDVGLYPYSVSEAGTFLYIESGTDDCLVRADSLPGTYERSVCWNPDNWCLGVLEAATYRSHFIEPRVAGEWEPRHGAMRFTVPEGWAAYDDWPAIYGLTTQAAYEDLPIGTDCFDCEGVRDTISVLSNPGAATDDCGEEGPVPGVGFGIQDLTDWLVGHPGLIAGEPETRTINGFDAITLVIEGSAEWTGTCDEENPFVAVPVFFREEPGYHWALTPGNQFQVTLIDLGGGDTVGVVVDAGDEADFDAFVEAARPIIESFEFPPR